MKSIIKLDLPEKCRLIAVSDIHTCCDLLEKMLKDVGYKPNEDYLVIVGDILEHWNNNINSVRYVKKLCDESDRAYCLMGNNDTFCVNMAYSYDYKRFSEKFYYSENRNENCFLQMAKSVGFDKCSKENWLDIRRAVVDKYKDEIEFLRDLPICLETQEYIFVHAGLEDRPDWQNTDDVYALTVKWFMRKENPTDKWLVVGHFPTYNYKRAKVTNLPIVDKKKKMIDIDGGLSVKTACQMNLFVIHKDGDNYTHKIFWESPFPKRTAIKDFHSELKPKYVDWSNQKIKLLGEKDGLLHLYDEVTGSEGYIPKRELYEFDGDIHVYQCLSSFPDVKKGEKVNVCTEDSGMYLVITENSTVGWIPKDVISIDS